MRHINKIIIHCTATEENRAVSVADVDRWHRARGFASIGYHFLVAQDGTVTEGRSIDVPGAHCRGHNDCSIGICYAGGLRSCKPTDTRTPEQRHALAQLIETMSKRFPRATIHGHREFAAKECPCFDAAAEYAPFQPSNPSRKW